ncbi:hypothetical protein AAAU16_04035 [Desulfovibrio piger]|uniref:hypothetical protein n=1 Tax=Desulfovibrio piger TaxID=901 RepID=UPI0032BF5AC7
MPSTASKLDIFNMALGFIGTRTIASANENTPEAIQCGLYWDRARRSALRDYPYRFAVRRVVLAEKNLPAAYAEEWRHAYVLPDGCLKVHAVHDGKEQGRKRPFRLESDAEGALLLCDVSRAVATCTFDVEEATRWDELFVMAMARKLAALVAVPLLKNNSGKVQELEQLYQLAVPRSDGQDASEGTNRPQLDGWIAARGMWS